MKEKRHLQQIRENNVTYINVSKEKYVLKKDKKSWKYYLFSTNSMWCGPHPGLQYFNTFNWKYQSIKPMYPWKYFLWLCMCPCLYFVSLVLAKYHKLYKTLYRWKKQQLYKNICFMSNEGILKYIDFSKSNSLLKPI